MEDTNFNHYWEYAKLWRTWVVGTAIGALFILLNKDVGGMFEERATVATWFIIAAGLQVLLAWVNKTAAYYKYAAEKGCRNPWNALWCWIEEQYWIDFIVDAASIFAVGWAVYLMIHSTMLGSPGHTR